MATAHHIIRTIPDLLREQARRSPGGAALEFGDQLFSYGQLEAHSDQLAWGLRGLGVGHGDRVGYLGKNSSRFFEVMFAATKLGAIVTPINWRLAVGEIAYILRDSSPAIVWVGREFEELFEEARDASGITLRTIVFDGEVPVEVALDREVEVVIPVPIDPEQTAILLYTSGTTGFPKGAMLSHRALLELRRREANGPDWLSWRPPEVCLVSMPLFHISGIRLALAAMYNGCRVLVVPEFEAQSILRIIHTRQVTRLLLVPAALQMLARTREAALTDFSRVRYIYYGGSPISPAVLQECMAMFGCGFDKSSGATHTAGVAVCLGPEDHQPGGGGPKMSSAGKPILGIEVKITSPQGDTLGSGEFGEVNIKSPGTMSGYWGKLEETRAVLGEDGWFRTGDGGFIDDDGYLFLKDRIKDMIISGGENVYPIEVENALAHHPSVAEVAVFGVPSEKWGEEVRAAVVLRAGMLASGEDLIAWSRERLAGYKAPKRVEFTTALPRNAGGKILKRELRARFAERRTAN
jgi:acyl-CoA synthetase (AMP-forming)/AMP-acid ligase II